MGRTQALTDEAVLSSFDQHRDGLYRIYRKNLAIDPLLSGCANYRLNIKPDGSLSEPPSFISSKITNTNLLKEISFYIFENISFPMDASDKNNIKVIYPICFYENLDQIPVSKEAEDWLKSALEEEAIKKATQHGSDKSIKTDAVPARP
jgi:hypothetical protein